VVTEPFHQPARLNAESLGVPHLPLVVLPHPVGDLAPEHLAELADAAWPHIRAALTEPVHGATDRRVDFTLPHRREAGSPDAAACEVCVE